MFVLETNFEFFKIRDILIFFRASKIIEIKSEVNYRRIEI